MTFRYQITGLLFLLSSLALAGMRQNLPNLPLPPPALLLSLGFGIGGALIFSAPRLSLRHQPGKNRSFAELNPSQKKLHHGLMAAAILLFGASVYWVSEHPFLWFYQSVFVVTGLATAIGLGAGVLIRAFASSIMGARRAPLLSPKLMRYPLVLAIASFFAFLHLVANTALDRSPAQEISALAEEKHRADNPDVPDDWQVNLGMVGEGGFLGWTELTVLSFTPDDYARVTPSRTVVRLRTRRGYTGLPWVEQAELLP